MAIIVPLRCSTTGQTSGSSRGNVVNIGPRSSSCKAALASATQAHCGVSMIERGTASDM
jgi:hypothetical protein